MTPDIRIVSMGSGDPELLNVKTLSTIRSGSPLFLRTACHPIAAWLNQNHIAFSSLDDLYETADDFEDLSRRIAVFLLSRVADGPIVYAVPDVATDHSVRILFSLAPDQVSIQVIPGVGTADVYLSRSISFLPESGLMSVPACDLLADGFYDPNHSILITELDNPLLAGDVKILLSRFMADGHQVFFLSGDNAPEAISLYELDRRTDIDHHSALLIPASGFRNRDRFVMRDLISIMETLRSPEGCPWDCAQTHLSLRPYVVEEAWECVDSIDRNDMDHLCEELGDLLFQVVFHASVGRSFDEFTIDDVISSICRKMIRRHPHVFGERHAADQESVKAIWERIKQEETGHNTVTGSLEDVSPGLPSLKYAAKSFKKLSSIDAARRSIPDILSDISGLINHLSPELCGIRESDLGILLMLSAELCFCLGMDGELVLHHAVDRLKERLAKAEKMIIRDGKSLECLTFDELGVYLRHVEGEIE